MGLDIICNNHARDSHQENHCVCVPIATTPPRLMLHVKGDRAHVAASLPETYTRRLQGERLKRKDPPHAAATYTCWQSTNEDLYDLI